MHSFWWFLFFDVIGFIQPFPQLMNIWTFDVWCTVMNHGAVNTLVWLSFLLVHQCTCESLPQHILVPYSEINWSMPSFENNHYHWLSERVEASVLLFSLSLFYVSFMACILFPFIFPSLYIHPLPQDHSPQNKGKLQKEKWLKILSWKLQCGTVTHSKPCCA